ncbi:hypothetical protein FRC17_011090 [Serendipita sp. 399]|nr:hypothetical protein FRC17_011090 [Serendipita sp. 399]
MDFDLMDIPFEELRSFVHSMATKSLQGSVPLSEVITSMRSNDPKYEWTVVKQTGSSTHIALVHRHVALDFVDVSWAGIVHKAASRNQGTLVSDDYPRPAEYDPNMKTYEPGATNSSVAKLQWTITDNDDGSDRLSRRLGSLEDLLDPLLREAIKGLKREQQPDYFRKDWNRPGDSYYTIEHPLFSKSFVFQQRKQILAEEDLQAADDDTHPLVHIARKSLTDINITPGLPRVCVASNVSVDTDMAEWTIAVCDSDEEYHRKGDIVWWNGHLHCIVKRLKWINPTTKVETPPNWMMDWWLDTVVRVGHSNHEDRTDSLGDHDAPTSPTKRRRMEVQKSPRKRWNERFVDYNIKEQYEHMHRMEAEASSSAQAGPSNEPH